MFHTVKWRSCSTYLADTGTGRCKMSGSQQQLALHHQLWGSIKPAELWQRLGSRHFWCDTSCRITGWVLLVSRTSREMGHTMVLYIYKWRTCIFYCMQSAREIQYKAAVDYFKKYVVIPYSFYGPCFGRVSHPCSAKQVAVVHLHHSLVKSYTHPDDSWCPPRREGVGRRFKSALILLRIHGKTGNSTQEPDSCNSARRHEPHLSCEFSQVGKAVGMLAANSTFVCRR